MLPSSNMGTKKDEKKREWIFNFKILKYELLSCINLVLRCAVSSGIYANQLFHPYLNHIYDVSLKLITLVCLMSFRPKYFVV